MISTPPPVEALEIAAWPPSDAYAAVAARLRHHEFAAREMVPVVPSAGDGRMIEPMPARALASDEPSPWTRRSRL